MSQLTASPPVAEKKSERFEMKIEPSLLARLGKQAARFSMSDSSYVRQAIIRKLEEDEATDPDVSDDEARGRAKRR